MCNPVAIFVLGTAMKYGAERQAQRRQQHQIDLAQSRNDDYTNRNIAELDKSTKQYDPTARAEAQHQAEQRAYENMTAAVGESKSNGYGDYIKTSGGDGGKTYQLEKAKRTVETANRASAIAAMLAKIRGASDLRTNEGINDSTIASNMARIVRQQRAMAGAAEQDIATAGRPNPLLMTLGSGMQAYGSYGMASGGGRAPAGTPVAQGPHGPVYQGSHGPYIPRDQFN